MMKSPLGLLMERNLLEVFGQKNPELRKRVISEIYTEDCVFLEEDEKIVGRDALNAKVGQILQDGAPGFKFSMAAPAQVIHDHGRLPWHLGPERATPVVTGMDIAVFERGRIHALYTFIDKLPSD
jgi:hypothetical protein